jgi:hypothetical protein
MYLLTKMARVQGSLIILIAWSESVNYKNVTPWSILLLWKSKLNEFLEMTVLSR